MQRPYCPRNSNRRGRPVEDLREKLNRIKQEKTLNTDVGTKNLPPPDPAYNYLKDPLRGDNCSNLDNEKKSVNKHHSIKHEAKCESNIDDEQKNPSKPLQNEKNSCENRVDYSFKKSGQPRRRQNWKNNSSQETEQPSNGKEKSLSQHTTKQQSVNNIKVTVSNESGQRKCIIDETLLVQLPTKASKNYTVRPKSDQHKQTVLDTKKGKNVDHVEKQIEIESNNQMANTDEKTKVIVKDNKQKLVMPMGKAES